MKRIKNIDLLRAGAILYIILECCITATFCPGSHGSRIQPSTHF